MKPGRPGVLATARAVTIGAKTFPYHVWDGSRLELSAACPYVAFDTETEIVDLTRDVPRLALAVASSGRQHVLLPPDRVAAFILAHPEARYVFFNAGFDFWVVDRHLRDREQGGARQAWWDLCHQDRMHDGMLLDMLIRLAEGRMQRIRGSDKIVPRNLAEVASEYTSLRISKEDPYRKRYQEILGKPWDEVEEGFFSYAAKDAIVTLRAYLSMMDRAERLMREHGYTSQQPLQDNHQIRPD